MLNDERLLYVRLRGWVEEETFRRLLKVADYVGREPPNAAVFKLNLRKIKNQGLEGLDIIGLLDEVGAEYESDLIEVLENSLSKARKDVATLKFDNGKLILHVSTYLGDIYRERLKDILLYDRRNKYFYTLPMNYGKLLKELRSLGFTVKDETGIQFEGAIQEGLRFTGELRDYQEEALKRWESNDNMGIVALPTGSGKTIIGIAAIAKLNKRTLVVTYTKDQLEQWRRALLEFTNIEEFRIGRYFSEEKRLAPVTLTTYQSAFKYVGKLAKYYPFLLIDEVHHLPAEKFKFIATRMPSPIRMGLSATPYREDGRHVELFSLMGGVVYHRTPQELMERGYLAEFKIITVKVPLKPDEKKRYLELRRKYRALVGAATFEEVLNAAKRGDRRAMEALRVHSELRDVIQKSRSKYEKVVEIAREELAKGGKIIIFAHYVDLAETLAKELNAYLLTGSMDEATRKKILSEFREVDRGILVVTTVGDEGIDIPDAKVGIFVAGTGSRRQFIQRLGRLLRPKPGKVARLYEIVSKGTAEEAQSKRRKVFKLDEYSEA